MIITIMIQNKNNPFVYFKVKLIHFQSQEVYVKRELDSVSFLN